MIGLAVLASALIGAGVDIYKYTIPVFLGFTIAFLFGIAGNAVNDYLDKESDKINHPERPIPSGKLRPDQVLFFSIFFFIISFILTIFLSLMVGYSALLVVLIAFISQFAYEKKYKHEKVIGNIVIGTQTALALIFGGVIVGKTWITGILAIAVFLSIVGREIVKDIEDVKGDKDRVTLPMIIGVRKAGIVASTSIVLAILISPLPYYPLHQFGWQYLIVISIADILFIGSIPIIFKNAKLARRMLKFAMLIAILAFIVGALFSV
jgi:geranylgeranylglycerol-phosphate geranylgeranyltransferase